MEKYYSNIMLFVFLGWSYFYYNVYSNISAKRKYHLLVTVIELVYFYFLFVVSGLRGYILLIVFVGFIGLAYFNYKKTKFCNKCGKLFYINSSLGEFCSKCIGIDIDNECER